MKNLGEKLKVAREAMGWSIKDASEITRLRSDYISNMEEGNFQFKLPEIYKRGFLRIYAKALKLDSKAIVDEYSVVATNQVGDENRHKHIIARKPKEIAPEIIESPSRYEDESDQESSQEKRDDFAEEKNQYLKLGAVFVAVLLGVVVLVSVMSAIMRAPAPKENEEIAMTQNVDISATPQEQVKELVVEVSATEGTYITVFLEGNENNPLYTGSLDAGATKVFKSKTPIRLNLTDAERVKVTKNGKVLDFGGKRGMFHCRIGLNK